MAARTGAVLWAVSLALVAAALWLRAETGGGVLAMGSDWSLAVATIAMSCATVGALIVARRPDNLVGWTLCALGVTDALAGWARYYASRALEDPGALPGTDWVVWLFAWLIDANFLGFVTLVLLFPHGRLITAGRRLGFALVMAATVAGPVATALSPFTALAVEGFPFTQVENPLAVMPRAAAATARDVYGFSLVAANITAIGTLAVRFRRSTGLERQQYKAFAVGALCAAAALAVGVADLDLIGFAAAVGFPAIPISAGVAVLRYRLYDIDRLLNRTLVYGLVTAGLAVVYIGGVVALQALLQPVAGESRLAVAASTLVVAALFRPVRRRVQGAVDRRFNRARYDAGRTVDAFRHRVREEVDVDRLSAALITAVGRTVQPDNAVLWLRPKGERR